MGLRTAIVPITEWLPLAAIARWPEDVALAGKDEIRSNRKFDIEQTRFEQFDRTTGVDRPERAVTLQLPDQFDAARIEYRIAVMGDESAVEVGTDQTNLSVHRSNLEIDFTNATSNGVDDEVRLRAGNGTAAKRLADYNIDPRAKGRTGGDRFLVQREDCGKKNFSD